MDEFSYYTTGLVDGEGSFSVSVQKDPTHRLGYRLKPSFSLGLHKEDLRILNEIRDNLDCGTIYFNKKMVQLKVEDIESLVGKVIPFFEKYPLRAKKKEDFEIFKKVVLMMSRKEHLKNVHAFLDILRLRSQMNMVGRSRRIVSRGDQIRAEVAQKVEHWTENAKKANSESKSRRGKHTQDKTSS